jgi:spore germination protein (amino acid permease)
VPVITANLVSLIYVYGQSYIEPYKITIVIILITAYAAYHDLKVQGKISEIMFIPTFLLVIFTFYGFKKGSILNLMPVFQTDFKDILSASRETLYAYVTIEILLLIHPFFKDTKSIKKLSFIALGLVVFIYFWVVFISIYFLGIDLVAINIWPFVMVSESINLPITSNFRTFFIVAWNLIQFKLISSVYFFSAFTFSSIIGLKRKRVVLYYLPIYIGLSMLFINQEARNIIFNYYVPSIIIFNILFITAIGIFTAVRSNKKNANTGNTKENK